MPRTGTLQHVIPLSPPAALQPQQTILLPCPRLGVTTPFSALKQVLRVYRQQAWYKNCMAVSVGVEGPPPSSSLWNLPIKYMGEFSHKSQYWACLSGLIISVHCHIQPDPAQLHGSTAIVKLNSSLIICGHVYLSSAIYSLVSGMYFQCFLLKAVSVFPGLLPDLCEWSLTQFNCWQLCQEKYFMFLLLLHKG